MLSFSSSLSPENKGIVVFVSENYDYKDKNDVLPKNTITKIDSFLSVLKVKKEKDQISSFDISEQQKCFIIKVKNKYEKYFPQESGGKFFSNLAKFKDIKNIAFYIDSLNFDKVKLVDFFSEFIFGLNLKSYTFNKYKTLNKEKNGKLKVGQGKKQNVRRGLQNLKRNLKKKKKLNRQKALRGKKLELDRNV